MSSKQFAIVGGTGLIGFPISKVILAEGHRLRIISRARSAANKAKLDELEAKGGQPIFCALDDVPALTQAFEGCDVVISIIHGTAEVIGEREIPILDAALAAKVKRFLPCEFGCNTMAMAPGTGLLFDEKKKFQQRLRDVGIDFTLIFPGLIFDYSLPNLREYEIITTYGNVELKYPVTHCEDIGAVTVAAALDPRCVNKGVQIAVNWISQAEFVPLLKKYYPDRDFPTKHVDTETVMHLAEYGDRKLPEEQPEIERFQINRACYVLGVVVAKEPHPDTLLARELYPEIVAKFRSIESALSDPEFVFGSPAAE